MNSIFLPSEVLHMQFQDISHHVVEHIEARCLLNMRFVAAIDHVKDRCKDLIHPLYILYLRIKPSKDEEYSSHVIISISDSSLLYTHLLLRDVVISAD